MLKKTENGSETANSDMQQLLREEERLWSRACIDSASDRVEEMCCGWKPVRPHAVYDVRRAAAPNKRRRAPATLNAASTLSVEPADDKSSGKHSYMSGELDENHSYVYRGGLSSRAGTRETPESPGGGLAGSSPYSRPRKHVQTVTLEPSAVAEASAHALVQCRDELSRILALQLKPELLVEQLIIENRLRSMSLAAFPVLENSRGGSTRPVKKSKRTYSQSTPSLGTLPNTHVDYQPPRHRGVRERAAKQRREGRHLQWCDSLTSQRSSGGGHQGRKDESRPHWTLMPELPELSHHQSALHHRQQQQGFLPHKSNYRHKPNCNHSNSTTNGETASNGLRYRLPVISPTLTSGAPSESQRKACNTLLSTAENSTSHQHHKPHSLRIGPSFYYPNVSYSNSKP